jgi:sugar phosphate isomerase/epimerase
MQLMMFTKHLAPLPLAQAASAMKELGFDGADLTVRPGGYVDPAHVRTALPEAINVLKAHGLAVGLLTTAITSAADPTASSIFESAATVGVREIKLGYWKYDRFGTFTSALDQAACDLDGIEKLARKTNVRANLHIHSENFITAYAPIVWHLIKDRDPAAIGAYVDPGHMCVEGGGDGWRIGLDLLGQRISLVAIKDIDWAKTDDVDPNHGKPRWYTRIVPLSRGVVPWPSVFACLRAIGFDGWLSVHSEYQGPHSWRDLTTQEVIEQTREDLAYLRQAMADASRASTQTIDRRAPRTPR